MANQMPWLAGLNSASQCTRHDLLVSSLVVWGVFALGEGMQNVGDGGSERILAASWSGRA